MFAKLGLQIPPEVRKLLDSTDYIIGVILEFSLLKESLAVVPVEIMKFEIRVPTTVVVNAFSVLASLLGHKPWLVIQIFINEMSKRTFSSPDAWKG